MKRKLYNRLTVNGVDRRLVMQAMGVLILLDAPETPYNTMFTAGGYFTRYFWINENSAPNIARRYKLNLN